VTITRHGYPAAVLISADDLAAIEETEEEILGPPGATDAIDEGLADAAARRGDYRVIYGVAEDTRTVEVLHIARRSDIYRR
jgi:PHD/YefM family antitoxin component YafN of YafNO toxin-antitoxin module